MMKLKKLFSWSTAALAAFALSFALVLFLAPPQTADANTANMADTYKTYETVYAERTNRPKAKYKYVWESWKRELNNYADEKYSILAENRDRYSRKDYDVTYKDGTDRKVTFSGGIKKAIVTASVDFELSKSSATERHETGKLRKATKKSYVVYWKTYHLYEYEVHTRRTAYKAKVKNATCVTTNGDFSNRWTVTWDHYTRCKSKDLPAALSATVKEEIWSAQQTLEPRH